MIYLKSKGVAYVISWDSIDTSSLYREVLNDYEQIIERYSFQKYSLNDEECVYVIQDTFVIYVGIINYGSNDFPNYVVVFEELLDNDIFKFNFSGFSRKYPSDKRGHIAYRRFHGIWGEPIRSVEGMMSLSLFIESKADYVNIKLPELKLKDRYNQWEGYLYNFIIYELSDGERTGYAIYCSDNPQIHKTALKMANEVEMQALELYATISQMDKSIVGTDMDFSRWQYDTCYLSQGVNSDGIMVDILMDKIEQHKANGWKHKHSKNVSSNKLCIAEHDLKYFWVSRYVKSKVLRDVLSVGSTIFEEVHNDRYASEPRYEYLIPENKWESEQLVYELTKKLYKKHTVLYQHRPFFLKSEKGQMSYDIFICGLNVAIEYQGKQHFEPVEIFGGEEHFQEQIHRDQLKKDLSLQNGVALVYINYWEDISPDLIKRRVELALTQK